MSSSRAEPGWLDIVASILVAFNLAIAQPLLDLLGRNAEFFIARDSPRGEIVGFALLVALLLPLSIAGVILVGRRIDTRIGAILHGGALSLLVGALALLLIDPTSRGTLWIFVALVAGILVSIAWNRSSAFRSIARFGLVLPVIVIALFLFLSPVSDLVFAGQIDTTDAKPVPNPAPVVMIVFDELPVASLMDRSGNIDEHLFPNFARLARSSTWFRNTTTVEAFTPKAVPAILDGRYPPLESLPTAQDHPNSLFTLLGPSYELHVTEPLTQLCPESLCARREGASLATRWDSLIRDAGIVAAHVVAPDDLAQHLPPIGDTWGGFAEVTTTTATSPEDPLASIRQIRDDEGVFAGTLDPRQDFAGFLDSFERGRAARLNFLHILTPHHPWRFLPSGQEYPQTEPMPGSRGREWGPDRWLVAQAYQRHLLQVAMVDGLIGDLIRTLKTKGLFDRSLVVVTADHGMAFRSGYPRRVVEPATVGEIAPVPLFVKRPSQRRGRIDDRPAETVDILPTIADVLGVEDLGKVDGRSLFEPDVAERTHRTITPGIHPPVRFPTAGREKTAVVQAKYETFPATPDGSLDLFGITPLDSDLVGRRLEELSIADVDGPEASIDGWDDYARLEPSADPIPAFMAGSLESTGSLYQPLVVAVNGSIVAMTRTYDKEGERAFNAMLPPAAFDRANDEVDLFVVADPRWAPVLIPVTERSR